ncbi:hypothetical protein V0R52_16425 [Pseudomonas asiatica]|uniref:hypothetical protein n=1 Tax=Pseudomonas asiatica TaxID=2219225 RepID=UPI002E7B009D|nr:hypothetical protein [Pseudomonas asiatica]MEE1917975.1 hypothetical protein [Pseudomonas asiatica]
MPTENRSSNTEMVSVPRDWLNSVALLQMPLDELQEQAVELLCEPCDDPAPQHHADPDGYPPCDYCGITPDYHPWHGSGMINGFENRHIHACDGCRGQLPSHPGQPHPEPIAWMVGTAIWWTKEEAERDAAATRLPIVGLGPMTYSAEVERLRAALKFYADREHYHFESGNWDTVSGEPLNILWCGDEPDFIEDGTVARAALERQP